MLQVRYKKIFFITSIAGAVIVINILGAFSIYSTITTKQLAATIVQQDIQLNGYKKLVAKQKIAVAANKEFIRMLRTQSKQSEYNLSSIQSMVRTATKTITDIKKLQVADKKVLAKYSKIFFLNENYIPSTLVTIPLQLTRNNKVLQVKKQVEPFLEAMFTAMKATGLSPRVVSAYRSFGYQENLKHRNTLTYGAGTANKFVADQGYSEHQLGTTVDISTMKMSGKLVGFEKTPEYTWLVQNASRYGFELSYPKGNSYYTFEPWHWRFVGVSLATKLYTENKYFYDMPQREIDTYRLKMFDK